MNLTVGPLPPAVYWRRRVLVLGVVLALVLLLVGMCGGSRHSNPGAIQPTATATSSRPSPTPTTSVQPPIVGAPGGASGSASPPGAPPSSAGPSPTLSDTCSDAEIQLTPSIQKITGGTYPYQLELDIKNISNRTCKRDDGANPQEMHIVNSAGQTVWSSDYCQSNPGSHVATFEPNIMASFQLPWDGYGYGPNCVRGAKLGDGSYQLVAKLDTKVSAPVAFAIGGK
jgi:hypothetical protein